MTHDSPDEPAGGNRLREFLAAWNSHDLDRIASQFHPEATIDDELVVIDPDRPAGRRRYHRSAEIRIFAALAIPGFRARPVSWTIEDARLRFVALVSAGGLTQIGIDEIEQHDELELDGETGLVTRFTIGYPIASQARLRDARARAERAGDFREFP